jgi:hypothetical protein
MEKGKEKRISKVIQSGFELKAQPLRQMDLPIKPHN